MCKNTEKTFSEYLYNNFVTNLDTNAPVMKEGIAFQTVYAINPNILSIGETRCLDSNVAKTICKDLESKGKLRSVKTDVTTFLVGDVTPIVRAVRGIMSLFNPAIKHAGEMNEEYTCKMLGVESKAFKKIKAADAKSAAVVAAD